MRIKAGFSNCGLYRIWLKRHISPNSKKILFVGLNPSKADDKNNDPTLRRLIAFSKSWGYGTLYVVNLFARVSFSPSIIKICPDPVGQLNNLELSKRFYEWSNNSDWDLWLGWGNKGGWFNRDLDVIRMISQYSDLRDRKLSGSLGPLAIGCTKAGKPKHPLYCSSLERLKPFDISKIY